MYALVAWLVSAALGSSWAAQQALAQTGCPLITGYRATLGIDHLGDDIVCHPDSADASVAAAVCNTNSSCAAFSTDSRLGFYCLKSASGNTTWGFPTRCFYIKNVLDGDLRLFGGNASSGRLEIYSTVRGSWGSVCSSDFDAAAASVACRQLGFADFGAEYGAVPSATYYGRPPLPDPNLPADNGVYLDMFACQGDEVRLTQCASASSFPALSSCSHAEDTALTCQPLECPFPWACNGTCYNATCSSGNTPFCDPLASTACCGTGHYGCGHYCCSPNSQCSVVQGALACIDGTDCTRPAGWCTQKGAVAAHVDCDGDGHLDWACSNSTGAQSVISSWNGCSATDVATGWPTAANSACPAAFGDDNCLWYGVDTQWGVPVRVPVVGAPASCQACFNGCRNSTSCFYYTWRTGTLMDYWNNATCAPGPQPPRSPPNPCRWFLKDQTTRVRNHVNASTCQECSASCQSVGEDACYFASWQGGDPGRDDGVSSPVCPGGAGCPIVPGYALLNNTDVEDSWAVPSISCQSNTSLSEQATLCSADPSCAAFKIVLNYGAGTQSMAQIGDGCIRSAMAVTMESQGVCLYAKASQDTYVELSFSSSSSADYNASDYNNTNLDIPGLNTTDPNTTAGVNWCRACSLWSSNYNIRATFQPDCNLVVYKGEGNAAQGTETLLWETSTSNASSTGCYLRLQPDGNLVLYSGTGARIWAALGDNTAGSATTDSNASSDLGYTVVMQSDGNLVVYPGGAQRGDINQAIWSSCFGPSNHPAELSNTQAGAYPLTPAVSPNLGASAGGADQLSSAVVMLTVPDTTLTWAVWGSCVPSENDTPGPDPAYAFLPMVGITDLLYGGYDSSTFVLAASPSTSRSGEPLFALRTTPWCLPGYIVVATPPVLGFGTGTANAAPFLVTCASVRVSGGDNCVVAVPDVGCIVGNASDYPVGFGKGRCALYNYTVIAADNTTSLPPPLWHYTFSGASRLADAAPQGGPALVASPVDPPYYSSPTSDCLAPASQCANFNSDVGINSASTSGQYLQLPPVKLGALIADKGFTVCLWFTFSGVDADAKLLDFAWGAGANYTGVQIGRDGVTPNLKVTITNIGESGASDVIEMLLSSVSIVLGVRRRHTCLAATPSGRWLLFTDGAPDVAADLGGVGGVVMRPVLMNSNFMGRSNVGSDGMFRGRIADLRLYDQALSDNQVAALYQAVSCAVVPGYTVAINKDQAQAGACMPGTNLSAAATACALNTTCRAFSVDYGTSLQSCLKTTNATLLASPNVCYYLKTGGWAPPPPPSPTPTGAPSPAPLPAGGVLGPSPTGEQVPSDSTAAPAGTNIGAIVGGVVGGAAALVAAVALALLLLRQRRQRQLHQVKGSAAIGTADGGAAAAGKLQGSSTSDGGWPGSAGAKGGVGATVGAAAAGYITIDIDGQHVKCAATTTASATETGTGTGTGTVMCSSSGAGRGSLRYPSLLAIDSGNARDPVTVVGQCVQCAEEVLCAVLRAVVSRAQCQQAATGVARLLPRLQQLQARILQQEQERQEQRQQQRQQGQQQGQQQQPGRDQASSVQDERSLLELLVLVHIRNTLASCLRLVERCADRSQLASLQDSADLLCSAQHTLAFMDLTQNLHKAALDLATLLAPNGSEQPGPPAPVDAAADTDLRLRQYQKNLADDIQALIKEALQHNTLLELGDDALQQLRHLCVTHNIDLDQLLQREHSQLQAAAESSARANAMAFRLNALDYIRLKDIHGTQGPGTPLDFVAQGGSGSVYSGVWQGQAVAVKKIECIADVRTQEEAAREAYIMSTCKHPNIAEIYGIAKDGDNGMACVVMRYYTNGSLIDVLRHQEVAARLTITTRLQIALDIARGMAYLHSRPNEMVVHGDLKPGNVLVDECMRAYVSDFGMSSMQTHTRTLAPSSNAQSLVYSAPELLEALQLQGQGPAATTIKRTTDADVYSYALTLYELFTGLTPFAGVAAHHIAWLVISGKRPYLPVHSSATSPPHTSVSGDSVPVPVARIIESCWQQEAYLRPAFTQITQALEAAAIALQIDLE